MLSPVSEDFEAGLRSRLPAAAFPDLSARYLEEPRGRYAGRGGLLVAPGGVEEVSLVVGAAAGAGMAVVPYGGGTGLVGGQIAADGASPVILSLERMTSIRDVLPEENVLIAEAGAILADVQRAAEAVGRLFPLSLASGGSARIGGLLATNAGGVHVLRYGSARDLALGLEAVLPDGSIWHGLSRLRKDNTGYDLRHLLIGSEGTLGVITAASLRLHPVPAVEGAAMMVVESPQAAMELLTLAQARIGGGISAFELIARMSFDFLSETMSDVRQPWPKPPDWAVLVDVGLPQGLEPDSALEGLFEAAVGAGLATDGVIARSAAQRAEFWHLRESIPEANRHIGSVSSHDISVPLGSIPEFIAKGDKAIRLLGEFRINCFGHIGDGNLHYNVFPVPGKTRADHDDQRGAIKRTVHDLVDALGGSVSAEHGIGRLKVEDLERYGDPTKLAALRAIKTALDPAGVMNPGAVLRALS